MGRKIQRTSTVISMERSQSGCMRGMIQALQQQPWHCVPKKMLPQRRRRGSEIPGDEISATAEDGLQQHSYTKIEEQATPSLNRKASVTSRIKAFITEEMSKRRGRHQRSRPFPVRMQLRRTDSMHRLRHPYLDSLSEASTDGSSHNLNNENSLSSDSYTKQGSTLNMKRELLLKTLLQKTNSNRWKSKNKGYAKSESFPLRGLPGKRRRKLSSMEDNSESLSAYLIKPETWDTNLIGLHFGMEKDGENETPRTRFKNLKERIKHAMGDSKKERTRIAMDAFLHKVPYGRNFSHDKREGSSDFWKDKGKRKFLSFKPPKTSSFDDSIDRYKRLYFSCFNTEATNHIVERLKLSDEETPLSSKRQSKNMARLYSLPDLTLYYKLQSGDLSDSTSRPVNKSYLLKEEGKTNSGLDETKPIEHSVSLENEVLFDTLVKRGHESRSTRSGSSNSVLENETGSTSFVDFKVESLENLSLDDLESLTKQDENHNQIESGLLDFMIEKMAVSNSVLLEEVDPGKPLYISGDEAYFPNQMPETSIDSLTVVKNKSNTEIAENSVDQLNNELLHLPVNSADIPKFEFVKYVLELSGFSQNELLGAWYSPEQPLDPSMFEEFYEEDQEGKNLENFLLFDLVNEVLLEIYEKSFTYCPIRLCAISCTRPVPMGHHVLEEVWAVISWHLSWRPVADLLLDETISCDLIKSNEWMNLHFEAECVGLELEDIIFEDLLEELVWT